MVPDLRPRGIGEILDAAAALYRARFGRLVRYAAIIVVPVQVLMAIVWLSAQPDSFSIGLTGNATPQFDTGSAQLGATAVGLVVGFLTNAFIVAVTTRVVANAYVDNCEGTGQVLGTTGRRLFAVTGLSLLVAISQLVGFAACGIGTLAVMTLFAVAVPALLLERKRVGGALSRSIELTRGHFWHVLGVVLAASLIGSILSASLAAALTLITLNASTTTTVLARGLANTVAAILATPFAAAATVALYFDLRIRDEAFDVQMAMAAIPAA